MGENGAYEMRAIALALSISRQAAEKRAKKESWPAIKGNGNGRGGKARRYPLVSLPADVQAAIVLYNNKEGGTAPTAVARTIEMLPMLRPAALQKALEIINGAAVPDAAPSPALPPALASSPSAALPIPTLAEVATAGAGRSEWTAATAISEKDLHDQRIRDILAILREAEAMPRDWREGKRKWIDQVAARHECAFQTVYRWLGKYRQKGIAGLRHTKASKDKPKTWTPEAIDFWVGLCAKREHRNMDRKDLYLELQIEAQRRQWTIGTYESALWWFRKKWNPCLEAMQRGGLRALDNIMPPVLRDYTDLQPFQILVGDQHRFDRWVTDEETGQVYRPEGYLWQDLRTRIIYGAAVDKKYDAWLIGLALRLGVACYGAFGSIYTDNGKPELSKYVTSILANMRALGMEWERTDDLIVDLLDVDDEAVCSHFTRPGTHRKAVVKNAKAKMIEGTFYRLERIMASVLKLAGHTKNLGDDIHWQDVDHHEAMKLAADGRLLTSREFVLALYRACDHYNRIKEHRGVLAEWTWRPKPERATPYDCLMAAYNHDHWRPRMVSASAADLLFLARDSRVVNKGRINFANDFFEHDALLPLHGRRVDLRYNPLTLDELHVFEAGEYLCTAVPVERSSMVDRELASKKIAEKRERRKRFAEEFRRLSAAAPDLRQYSTVPRAERAAALIGDERQRRAQENRELHRPVTQEEITAHIAAMEQGLPLPSPSPRPLPPRPKWFLDDYSHFEWIVKYLKAGGALDAADELFKDNYLAGLAPDQRDYYEFQLRSTTGGNG